MLGGYANGNKLLAEAQREGRLKIRPVLNGEAMGGIGWVDAAAATGRTVKPCRDAAAGAC